jgi:indolepyruvate ferredoxin oxidoreductase
MRALKRAIVHAIELNGAAIMTSRAVFLLGRRAALDVAAALAYARPQLATSPAPTIDEISSRRGGILSKYQDAAYAARYRKQEEKVRTAKPAINSSQFTEAVAHNLFSLMVIKDEYKVARLNADTDFLQQIGEHFEGKHTLSFHLAPPPLARSDPKTGTVRKMAFGHVKQRSIEAVAPERKTLRARLGLT